MTIRAENGLKYSSSNRHNTSTGNTWSDNNHEGYDNDSGESNGYSSTSSQNGWSGLTC
jgi:hypothetical protein